MKKNGQWQLVFRKFWFNRWDDEKVPIVGSAHEFLYGDGTVPLHSQTAEEAEREARGLLARMHSESDGKGKTDVPFFLPKAPRLIFEKPL